VTWLFRRQWIAPWPLAFALLSHGASWILLCIIAQSAAVGAGAPEIAWIHLVALGWFTMAALAILIHVIPGSTDLEWRGERVARSSVAVFAAGVVAFIAAWLADVRIVAWAAVLLAIGIGAYLWTALRTLAAGKDLERTQRAISRAFAVTLVVFGAAALLGLLLGFAVSGYGDARWLASLAAPHADLAMIGWLSLLVYGVSARTMRPICGLRSIFPHLHVLVGTATLIGVPLLAVGLGIDAPALSWIGGALIAVGAIAFVVDITAILSRATVTHRPPQAFVAAALMWLCCALAFGGATLAGVPIARAYVFTMLIGWIGQMVNAHMLHIGVRVAATALLGDDDETRPGELLEVRLSWAAFAGMQTAVVLCIVGLAARNGGALFAGAAIGALSWLLLIADFVIAVTRSRRRVPYSPAPAAR
jgi:hypothetical protein